MILAFMAGKVGFARIPLQKNSVRDFVLHLLMILTLAVGEVGHAGIQKLLFLFIMNEMRYLSAQNLKKFSGKTCLLRIDLNIEPGAPLDSYRLQAVIPTIRLLLKNRIRVVILSHRGRPEIRNPKSEILNKSQISKFKRLSLKPFARVLCIELGRKVDFLTGFDFPKIKSRIEGSKSGSVFLLENLRFSASEEANDEKFARALAALGDFYVNDAFAFSHRPTASIVGITKFLPSYGGLLLEKEIKNLGGIIDYTTHPFVIVLGGAKLRDKLSGLNKLVRKADAVLLGSSAFNESGLPKSPKFIWPEDARISASRRNGRLIWDIGPFTLERYASIIGKAKTIIWNGPPGFFEKKGFEKGTVGIWKAVLKSASRRKEAHIVVGGGETLASLKLIYPHKSAKISINPRLFLSTGGGAMLEHLSGKKLPGIEVLK